MLADRKKAGPLSDEQIAAILKSGHFKQENQALELPLSVVNAVIGAPISAKLKPNEISSLIQVKWQAYMLANEARLVNEFIRLTFTVSDDDNHRTIVANHQAGIRMYGRRAAYLLDQVRAALKELEAPGVLSRIHNRFCSRGNT
jgi:hypothetical protein